MSEHVEAVLAPTTADLRTLLICDLVNSTQLTERLGDRRAAELFGRHDRLVRGLLDESQGMEINKSDGFLLLFERPSTAVLFALAYQRVLLELSEEADARLTARVGIHLGEVLLHPNSAESVARGAHPFDVDGLAIAVTARLQSLAQAGQILLTRPAFEVARRGMTGRPAPERDLRWRSHGDYLLQGISEPVEVCEVAEAHASSLPSPPDSQKARRALSSPPRVLVIPFTESAAAVGEDVIGVGLTDEIITSLSRVAALRVISRSSALQLQGTTKSVQELGRELNVQYVVEGSIQRAGDRLRIAAQLARAGDEQLLWAERFTGHRADLFEIQETIARAVAHASEVRLTQSDEARLAERPIPNVQAYEYYLRAKQQVFTFTAEALDRALEYLQKGAALLGSENAHLIAAMGYVNWQYCNAGIRPDPVYLERARQCAERLRVLDPESPDAHRLLGLVGMQSHGDSQAAIRHLRRGLAASPNDTDILFWLSLLYGFVGRSSSGYPLIERLMDLDPLTNLHHILPGFLAMLDGDLDRARQRLRVAHELDRSNPMVTLCYGQALAMSELRAEADATFAALEADQPESFFAALGRVYRAALSGDRERTLEAISADVVEACHLDLQYSWTLAQCLSLVGATQEALGWLSNAVKQGFLNYPLFAERDPLLAGVRQEPDFAALARDLRGRWIAFEA